MTSLRFCFDLAALDDVAPWGKPGNYNLHWFGLTQSYYWIETSAGELLRYTDEILRHLKTRDDRLGRYVDYYLSRLFGDVFDVLPAVLEPVPRDIVALVSDERWYQRAKRWQELHGDDDARWELWGGATEWWHDRTMDFGYLNRNPWLTFWQVEDEVFLQWDATGAIDGIEAWVPPALGRLAMGAAEFTAAIDGFSAAVIAAMEERVAFIARTGWQPQRAALDIAGLVAEQRQRADDVRKVREKVGTRPPTDWPAVREKLDRLCRRMETDGE